MKARYALPFVLTCLSGQWSSAQDVTNNSVRYHNATTKIGSSADNDNATADDPVFIFPIIGCVGYQNGFDLYNSWDVGPWGFLDGTGAYDGYGYYFVQCWEDEEGSLCSYDSGDDYYWQGDVEVDNTVPEYPMEWAGNGLIGDYGDWYFGHTGVWCYEHGGNAGDPLTFADISPGQTRSHINNNGTTISLGTTVALPSIYNDLGYTSHEAYYSFVLTAPASVTLSTDLGNTAFDTQLTLYSSDGTQLGFNEDGGVNINYTSVLVQNLCQGQYKVKVSGYQGATGPFTLGVTTQPWAPFVTAVCSNTTVTLSSDQTIDLAPLVAGSSSQCGTGVLEVSPASIVLGPQNAGPNPVEITVGGTATCTATITVIIADGGCVPTSVSGTTGGDFIDGVELAGISNTATGGITGASYNDYTDQFSTNLERGANYDLTITSGNFVSDHYAAWIDYDRNDVFDTDEKLGEFFNTDFFESQVIGFTVPAGTSLGATIMRVRGVYFEGGEPTPVDPCFSYYYGETEDYGINIVALTGMDEQDLALLQVYPNPTNGLLNVMVNGELLGANSVIEVTDLLGRTISTQRAISGLQQIDLSGQPKGIYVVQVRDGANVTTRRITLQ